MVTPQEAKNKLVAYSEKMVNEKKLISRVYNSDNATITGFRRGMQRSDGKRAKGVAQKILPTIGAAAPSAVPFVKVIPVIPSIIDRISDNINAEIKDKYRRKKTKDPFMSRTDDEELTKFTFKTFSLPDLDSHRQKLDVALREFNRLATSAQTSLDKSRANGDVCQHHLEMCMAISQVQRRVLKMVEAYHYIDALKDVLVKKIDAVAKDFEISEEAYWKGFDSSLDESQPSSHSNCKSCLLNAGDFNAPLDAKFAKYISNNKVFAILLKNSFNPQDAKGV